MKIFCKSNQFRFRDVKASYGVANGETTPLDAGERKSILRLFRLNDIDILETYEDEVVEDGYLFNELVVVTDNTNQFRLGRLLSDIDQLEDKGIGCNNESNDHGFYAKDYHFYHYPED